MGFYVVPFKNILIVPAFPIPNIIAVLCSPFDSSGSTLRIARDEFLDISAIYAIKQMRYWLFQYCSVLVPVLVPQYRKNSLPVPKIPYFGRKLPYFGFYSTVRYR